ncbi:MAG: hypothetical protein AB4058_18105 [Microcystaceae cyanobacterium]
MSERLSVISSQLEQIQVNPEFIVTLKRLLELTEIDPDLDENDEDEALNPSEYAFLAAIKVLNQLYEKLARNFPRGLSNLESRGGINLIWTNQEFDKEVRIKIPISAEFSQLLSYYKGDDGELVDFSLEKASHSLHWLQTDSNIH